MASIFLKSTATFFLIFYALSMAVAAVLVDTDGNLLINSGNYYIIPKNTGGGPGPGPRPDPGLTLISINGTCFVTIDKEESSPGLPMRIILPENIGTILPGLPVNFAFNNGPEVCKRPLGWRVVSDETSGKSYVTTGGDVYRPMFSIEDTGVIKYVANGESKGVGFSLSDRLLEAIMDDTAPAAVSLMRA